MMRALGMGTSGSLCRIGAMVAPFISQVQPRSLCSREGGERGGGICLKEMGKVGHRALSSERFKQGISVDVMSILEGCFPIVG